ncbi:hypothetical protein [Brevibacterium oceani]|uniref:hypothetical protein n=1 Tax=Brevibacterium oceani TaxID=358099 RepID=UPI0015E660C7|nr:hypothetical protein [Brevibacterium oceani]
MDMTSTIQPRSDQLNADDLLTGPMTVTITEVTQGNAEQPVNVNTVETPGRPYKPSKSMRRVMVTAWGKDANAYAGKRLTLFRNPKIRFGKDEVGGIEISHMSDIDADLKVSLTATRGKKKLHTVKPLAPYTPSQDFLALMASASTGGEKNAIWQQATEDGADQTYLVRLKEAGS